MRARLIILVLLGAGLAVYYALRTPAAPNAHVQEERFEDLLDEPGLLLWHYDLPGTEPAEPPDLELTFRVDPSDGKQRIYFNLSEAHDYYVETFVLEFWYLSDPDMEFEDSPVQIEHYVDRYIKVGEVLEDCLDVADAELAKVDGQLGVTENWAGRLTGRGHTRARTTDPPEPRREDVPDCTSF